jgi:hypothetical protein
LRAFSIDVLMLSAFLYFGLVPVRSGDLSLEGVLDLDGRTVNSVSSSDKQKSLVLIFMSVDCPISNRYAPTLRKLKAEFQNVRFVLIYPNRDEAAEVIHEALGEYQLPFETWRDTKHGLVKAAQAKVTPEAAVFVPGKGWVYRGRIDDQYVDWGKHRPEAKVHDLRDVLAALSKGEVPALRTTKAVGCYISKIAE